MQINNIQKMLEQPDMSVIYDVYFKISLKAFKEYFTDITHSEKYFGNIYDLLLQIASESYPDTPKDALEEHLVIGTLIGIAESILKNKNADFKEVTALFIFEKLFIEPLVILGKEFHNNN